jgi:Uma2 family endonuclease
VIYVPAPATLHEAVFTFLISLLKVYVDARDLGEVLGSRSAIRLDDYSAPQPDILFIRKERRQIIRRLEIIEAPDLIMEIVASDAGRQRAIAKMIRYAQFSVPEFWYIDLPRQFARLCHLADDGQYAATAEGNRCVMASRVVPGFSVRARWLWSEPGKFPSVFAIVQELLAGRLPR